MKVVQFDTIQRNKAFADQNMKHKLIRLSTKRFTFCSRFEKGNRTSEFLHELCNEIRNCSVNVRISSTV